MPGTRLACSRSWSATTASYALGQWRPRRSGGTMDGDVVGQGGTELRTVARLIAETVPRLAAALAATKPGPVPGAARAALGRPGLPHPLALTAVSPLRV